MHRDGCAFGEAWNFGPAEEDAKSVEWILGKIAEIFADFPGYAVAPSKGPVETSYLRLDCSKAHQRLGWKPRWNVEKALHSTWEWLDVYRHAPRRIGDFSLSQIQEYLEWK